MSIEPVIPAVALPESLVVRPDIMQRLDFAALFGNGHPVELELGAGDGSLLLRHAAAHPGVNFIGVERLLGRLRKIDRKGRRLGLANLRAIRLEAAYLLEWMIPAASLSAIHVYFPDPWPKRRHWKRRLVNLRFTELAARALVPGGRFYVRTDDASYFQQMTEVGNAQAGFSAVAEPPDLLAVTTDFEADFNRDGIPTLHAAWERNLAEPTTVKREEPMSDAPAWDGPDGADGPDGPHGPDAPEVRAA